MKQVKITIIRKAEYRDLMERYENLIEHACDMQLGAEFISRDAIRPDGMCESAWMSLQPFVFALASGASNLYDGWMRNPHTAMVSCNDGFRPVSFLLEAIE
ncbi:MAG: TIGR04076 family protein [Muribaculaceae bacterium]